MAPQKGKARGQSAPQPSDYETDAPPPAVDVPLPPPRSNEELNFSVLKRSYPNLVAIEHVTPYAALYTFNVETQQWEKVGIEGTLFICQLAPSPTGAEQYCVVILNRRGLDNFYMELTSSETMEISDPYVILQGDLIYGLWIFADPPPASTQNCRVETAEKMLEIADRARASREAAENGVDNTAGEVDTASAPMGRQLSLRQLFGQQHGQDGTYDARSLNHQPPPDVYRNQPTYTPTPDARPAQQDVLGQLFMKAKQDYNGLS
jgi:hypothetical protein